MDTPLIVLSDLHLAHQNARAMTGDLQRLVSKYGRHELIFAGDVFDLSHQPIGHCATESIAAFFREHPALQSALHEQLSSGAPVTFLAGNHDEALVDPKIRDVIVSSLDVSSDAPLTVSPWFVRRGKTHIEHGHLYDPDNAPAHPLSNWSENTEPLGVALTRRFLVPTGAHAFAHAHETTPLRGLLRAFKLYGIRTPWIIVRYFTTAIGLCLESGQHRALEQEREQGAQRLAAFAAQVGVAPEVLETLTQKAPEPTHARFQDVFMRLYFDRVIAALLLSGSALAAPFGGVRALALVAATAGYLGASVRSTGSRYSGLPEQRLRDAAQFIADATDASCVVFGHTHSEDQAPRYLNCGSFAFSRRGGRPYVRVDEHGVAERFAFA